MTCQEMREWQSAEIDGEARGAKRAVVREHLARCPACRQAREASMALRLGLEEAAWAPADEERDAMLLAVLRKEGLCGGADEFEPRRHKGHEGKIGRWTESVLAACLRCTNRILSLPSLRAAAAAMAVSFLLSWGSLRWASTGRAVMPAAPGSLSAGAPARPLNTEVLDEWMAGTPTLAELSRLQWLPARSPAAPKPVRRGAAARNRVHVG